MLLKRRPSVTRPSMKHGCRGRRIPNESCRAIPVTEDFRQRADGSATVTIPLCFSNSLFSLSRSRKTRSAL